MKYRWKALIAFAIVLAIASAGISISLVIKHSKTFFVSFVTFGGTQIATQEVKYSKKVTKPQNPNKDGSIFLDWHTSPALQSVYDFGSPVKSDLILYAEFVAAVTVNFDTYFDFRIDPKTVPQSSRIGQPTLPERVGFIFIGWYLDAEFLYPFDFSLLVTQDITLHALWERQFFVLSFDTADGTLIENQHVLPDELPVRPPNPAKAGFDFVEWYTDPDFNSVFRFDLPLTGDLTAFALFEPIEDGKANIVFCSPNPPIVFFVERLSVGEILQRPSDPDPNLYIDQLVPNSSTNFSSNFSSNYNLNANTEPVQHYRFEDWYVDPLFADLFEFGQPVTQSFYVYAKLSALAAVSFFVCGDIYFVEGVFCGDFVAVPDPPKLDGREFLGWFLDEEGKELFDFLVPISGNISVFAVFSSATDPADPTDPAPDNPDPDEPTDPSDAVHTVVFVDFDGEILGTSKVSDGGAITPPQPADRPHYTFLGFTDESELAAVTTGMVCRAVYAYSDQTDPDLFEYVACEGGLLISAVKTSADTLFLPEFYGGKAVLGIAATDFGIAAGRAVTRIFIPFSYVLIGENAFLGHSALAQIEFERSCSLEFIGAYAFAETSIRSLLISKNAAGHAITVGEYAFAGCFLLTQISLSLSVKTLESHAFFRAGGGENPVAVDILGAESIGESAFAYALVAGELLLESCKTVGNNAFYYSVISILSLPNIEEIGDFAFYPRGAPSVPDLYFDAAALRREMRQIVLGEGLKSVGSYALWYDCGFDLPRGLQRIGSGAFMFSSLGEVVLTDALTELGGSAFAFARINNLTFGAAADIPANAFYRASIGGASFDGAFLRVGGYAFYCAEFFGGASTALLQDVGLPKQAGLPNNVIERVIRLPEGVIEVGTAAFYGCNLSGIILPSTLATIGERAFAQMQFLTAVTLPAGVATVAAELFFGCTSLEYVEFLGEVVSIGDGAFFGCGLTSLDLPSSLISLGASAFAACPALATVKIGELIAGSSLRVFGYAPFEDCPALAEIYIFADLPPSTLYPEYGLVGGGSPIAGLKIFVPSVATYAAATNAFEYDPLMRQSFALHLSQLRQI